MEVKTQESPEVEEFCIICQEPCRTDDILECCPQHMHLRCFFETLLKADVKKCPHCRRSWSQYIQGSKIQVSRNSVKYKINKINEINNIYIYYYLRLLEDSAVVSYAAKSPNT